MQKTILGIFVFAALCCAPAAAQPVGFGLKLGVPATDAFDVVSSLSLGSSQHFTWGPYFELHLPGGNGIEIDALRREYDFRTMGDAGSWEFPVMLKHRIGSGWLKPYFEGGASFQHLMDINISTLQHRQNFGIVAGGGVEFKLLFLKLSPEFRYTGWALKNFDGALSTNRNQFTVLMGFGF